jgi:2-C-methyl-D-erythritol 2,4-cyclodiphosphate synthase
VRIGQGIDVHRISGSDDRELWLGLIHVPDAPGLEGHSDADVATHALCDALLGASNLGDLGRYFPDTDPQYHDAPSLKLLEATMALVRGEGFRVMSGDVTIIAERPKLAIYMPAMSQALSSVVGATVSVKATTTEGLGAIGHGEGIGASAVVLLEEQV